MDLVILELEKESKGPARTINRDNWRGFQCEYRYQKTKIWMEEEKRRPERLMELELVLLGFWIDEEEFSENWGQQKGTAGEMGWKFG